MKTKIKNYKDFLRNQHNNFLYISFIVAFDFNQAFYEQK